LWKRWDLSLEWNWEVDRSRRGGVEPNWIEWEEWRRRVSHNVYIWLNLIHQLFSWVYIHKLFSRYSVNFWEALVVLYSDWHRKTRRFQCLIKQFEWIYNSRWFRRVVRQHHGPFNQSINQPIITMHLSSKKTAGPLSRHLFYLFI